MIYLGRRLITGLNVSTIRSNTFAKIRGSLVNWRGISLDARLSLITGRGSIFIIIRRGICITGGGGVLVISLGITSKVRTCDHRE